ncbi:MAG: hypothetical protein V4671_06325 [Armatimonadota bacterium]
MYTPGPKPPFDVRDIVPGSELDNDHLQARYDTANRMILLMGAISFERLFTEKWKSLLPEIICNIPKATNLGLLRDRADLRGLDAAYCLNVLLSACPDLSWSDYTATNYKRRDADRDKVLDPLFDAHVALWRQGIYFPHPLSCSKCNTEQCEAMHTLATTAGSRTYQAYFERLLPGASSDWKREEIAAFKAAIKAGVLFNMLPNDRCCNEEYQECENFAPGKDCLDCSDEDDPCDWKTEAVPPV